jgi:hypothetical protein
VVDDGCPTSIIRSTASADTTASATFGGGGGTFFVEGCDHGTVLTGLLGRSSSTTIHRVQPVCSTYSLLTTPGLPESSYRLTTGSPGIAGAAYGGGGGSAFDDACPAGEVVVGIRGRADDEVRRLQLQCGRISVERVGGPWTAVTAPTVLTPARGGTSGTVFTYDCPSGHGVVMITGSAGERVDAIRVFCQRFVADLL